ncbi:MAG: flavodoxin family protein [Candidatus Hodarchaeota archaeon]
MKPLVVFYSRTGTTKKIAELISKSINCELEEIIDTKKRTGFIIGFLKSGYAAMKEKLTIIEKIQKNPELYDLIILGTPIWSSNMTPAIRTYISENKSKFKNIAYFCTEGGDKGYKAFERMEILCEKKPVSTLEINKKEIKKATYVEKINSFVQKLK